MKRFAFGVAVGLMLAAAPGSATWDWTDTGLLKEIANDVRAMSHSLKRIADHIERKGQTDATPIADGRCRNKAGAIIPCVEKP